MFTLNIYTKQGQYLHSVTQETRKACLKVANAKYQDYSWDWDDKNYVKNKKYNGNPSTTVSLSLSSLI